MLSRRSNISIGLAVVAVPLLLTGPAGAQSAQDQKLLVQARIGEICTVTSASLDFGADVDLESVTNAEGTIEISCIAETSVNIGLNGGVHNQFGTRAMSDGQNFIRYALYTDAARSNEWTTGVQVPATISSAGSVPVYGRIPSQTNGHAAGLYTDEVTITLSF